VSRDDPEKNGEEAAAASACRMILLPNNAIPSSHQIGAAKDRLRNISLCVEDTGLSPASCRALSRPQQSEEESRAILSVTSGDRLIAVVTDALESTKSLSLFAAIVLPIQ